ncbi:DUF2750 domain-containing protein [Spartinivicinus ruber]|uniref:DUF2750 domain-containing protein n=1 Tax=Spartinivicinus ruber TaxID=2683272 RepID=UPI0013D7D5B0|nr:DUF2750 domain-containing protein [Spartinivicinus ruber]
MRSPLTDELNKITTLSRLRRYQYFMKEVAINKEVWTLYKGHWAINYASGYQLFPLWPNESFALACAIQNWQQFKPIKFSLDILLTDVIEMLDKHLLFPCIFDTPFEQGSVINTQLLKDDLLNVP